MVRSISALAVLAFVLVAAPAAHAYDLVGPRWPGNKITYYVADTKFRGAARAAARNWNRANVGVVFRAAASRDRADVVVREWDTRCGGAAIPGFLGHARQSPVLVGAGCRRAGLNTIVLTHELGHVLGLGHENSRCALMNPTFDHDGTPEHCKTRALGYWLTNPIQVDDLRGARVLY